MSSDPIYREVQRFRQWWVWALLVGAALFTIVLGPFSIIGLTILGVVSVLLYSLRLETEVRGDGIYIKMWPLHRSSRHVSWSKIERYEARQYSPLREFGGWGIRWKPGKIAYNVSGDKGVWIRRTTGRSILIGSQRAQDFIEAIDEVNASRGPHR